MYLPTYCFIEARGQCYIHYFRLNGSVQRPVRPQLPAHLRLRRRDVQQPVHHGVHGVPGGNPIQRPEGH
jgi:hypothetical protein